jgi:hypothetical protein
LVAAIDDTVTLPGHVRVDAALFVSLTPIADSNPNISPGSPRALRVALITRF